MQRRRFSGVVQQSSPNFRLDSVKRICAPPHEWIRLRGRGKDFRNEHHPTSWQCHKSRVRWTLDGGGTREVSPIRLGTVTPTQTRPLSFPPSPPCSPPLLPPH